MSREDVMDGCITFRCNCVGQSILTDASQYALPVHFRKFQHDPSPIELTLASGCSENIYRSKSKQKQLEKARNKCWLPVR